MHVLPKRFHRIRHYGLFANGARAENIARARELLNMAAADSQPTSTNTDDLVHSLRCPCCGGRLFIIQTFARGTTPRPRPSILTPVVRFDRSISLSTPLAATSPVLVAGYPPAPPTYARFINTTGGFSTDLHCCMRAAMVHPPRPSLPARSATALPPINQH